MKGFCLLTAWVAVILSVLYLFDVAQYQWMLNLILAVGAVMCLGVSFLTFYKKKKLLTLLPFACLLINCAALIWINFI
jgi:hypothetical protein